MENRYYGVYQGRVISTADPDALNRVRVIVPQVTGKADSAWALPSVPKAPQPLIGALVWVSYNNGEPNRPVYYAQAFAGFSPTFVGTRNAVLVAGAVTFAHGAPFTPVSAIPVGNISSAVMLGVGALDGTNITLKAYNNAGAFAGTIAVTITYFAAPRT